MDKSVNHWVAAFTPRQWENKREQRWALSSPDKVVRKGTQLTSFVFFVPLCFLSLPIAQARQSTLTEAQRTEMNPAVSTIVYSHFGTARGAA